ncbi:hypothetical protein JOC48_001297 [Aquibacillus albus]|uniref:Uncharacterized protein n=1 Tax=Aquibacillus albus TaxID=1168171 RepID=A0ABS2MY53_9BACI|nr:hypothetical protein [Aquibacillus albus]
MLLTSGKSQDNKLNKLANKTASEHAVLLAIPFK